MSNIEEIMPQNKYEFAHRIVEKTLESFKETPRFKSMHKEAANAYSQELENLRRSPIKWIVS